MGRRMIVLFCFIWGIGCITLLCILANADLDSDYSLPDESAIVFAPAEQKEITFPVPLQGTDLIVRGIYPYDGAFWEDGSGCLVTGVAAILVENAGSYGIEKANIVVGQGDRLLKFDCTTIPPGAQVVILERNKSGFSRDRVKYCFGSQRLQLEGWDLSVVSWESPDIATLCLTNVTDSPIYGVELLYKDHLQGMYVGGATNSYYIEELLPGETIQITPKRFAGGVSKILCILTDINAIDKKSVA